MDNKNLVEAKTLLETARKRLLDAHRDMTDAPDELDWELAANVIELARHVDTAHCRVQGLLKNEPHLASSQQPLIQSIAATRVGRRSKSDYTIQDDVFTKTGSTWEHKLDKADFAKVVQSIKNISSQSNADRAAFELDDVVKTTRVSKRYIYDAYTCLLELGMIDRQHKNVFYITKEQANNLDIADIWERIKQLATS